MEEQTGKRQVIVVMRERQGRTLPFVFAKESDAIPTIRARVPIGSIVHADEARGWDSLHAHYDMQRINHSVAFCKDGACTNQAESFFSRARRSEIGIHHRISRSLPSRLRFRDGVARGSSAHVKRRAVQHCGRSRDPPSREPPVEPVLATERGMTDNGNQYALAALKERRAVIDGELRECKRRVRYLQEALGHLDATLALFDPDGNPNAIRPKRPYRRVNHSAPAIFLACFSTL